MEATQLILDVIAAHEGAGGLPLTGEQRAAQEQHEHGVEHRQRVGAHHLGRILQVQVAHERHPGVEIHDQFEVEIREP